jgi:hypothetical protein
MFIHRQIAPQFTRAIARGKRDRIVLHHGHRCAGNFKVLQRFVKIRLE